MDGQIVATNNQARRSYGYTKNEFATMTVAMLVTDKETGHVPDRLAQFRHQGHLHCESEHHRKNGSVFPVDIRAQRCTWNGQAAVLAICRDITERKRAEAALRQSEEKYRALFVGCPQGILAADAETGRFLYVNPAICRMLGYSAEELCQLRVADIHPRDALGHVQSEFKLLVAGIKSHAAAIPMLRKDGSIFPADVTAAPTEANGQKYVVGFFSDVTGRQVAEEALRESEVRHRTILQTAMDGFWVLDKEGRLLDVNTAYCRMSGYSREELQVMKISNLEVHEAPEETSSHISKIIAKGEERFETRHRRKDGSIIDVEVSSQFRSGFFYTFLRDITERKRVEQALRESEAQQKAILNGITTNIALVDKQMRILWANQASAISVNKRPEDLVGHPCYAFWGDSAKPCANCPTIIAVQTGQSAHKIVVSPDGRIWDEASEPILDAAGNVTAVVEIAQDITERKRAETELVRAKEAADAANRAKSEFLATMSHELRTPLNPVLGFTDLLAQAPNLTDEQRSWLGMVSQRGRDLLHLIEAVLDLSKIEARKIEIRRHPLALRQTMRDLTASTAPAAEKKGLDLVWEVDPDLPDAIMADGFRLRQVLLNLLNNAIKFTPRGRIRVQVQDGRAAPLARPPEAGEVALLFRVQDTGIGIAADRQAAIFEAFTHADHQHAVEYGGAGLGLAIAWQLVDLMGGRIWVKSREHHGSTFFFTVLVGGPPAAIAAAPRPPDAVAASGNPKPARILVVDDDPASLALVQVIAKSAGHLARTAANGRDALACLETETVDLVLLDIRMPVLDGMETIAAIRDQDRRMGRHTPVIALTAHAMEGDRERFLNAGMDGYLAKPIQSAGLLAAIQQALAV